MILVLDANALVSRPFLEGRKWDAIHDAISAGVLELWVPDLAIREAVAIYTRRTPDEVRGLRKSRGRAAPDVRAAIETAAAALEASIPSYETKLRARISELTGIVLSVPDISHEDLAERALQHTAPFDSTGSGYRDALHWFAVLEALDEDWSHEDRIVSFVSHDKKAFGPERRDELRKDVAALEEDWRVEFLADIEQFKVPGQFLDDLVVLDVALRDDIETLIADELLRDGDLDAKVRIPGAWPVDGDVRVTGVSQVVLNAYEALEARVDHNIWVTFRAAVEGTIETETISIYDEDGGWDRDVRQYEAKIVVDGSVLTTYSGEHVSELASLHLVSVQAGVKDDVYRLH